MAESFPVKEETNGAAQWVHLPPDILGLIAEQVSFVDRLRMMAASKRWRDAMVANGHLGGTVDAAVCHHTFVPITAWLARHGPGIDTAKLAVCCRSGMLPVLMRGFAAQRLRSLALECRPSRGAGNRFEFAGLSALTALTELSYIRISPFLPACVADMHALQRLTFQPTSTRALGGGGLTYPFTSLPSPLTHLSLVHAPVPNLVHVSALKSLHIRESPGDSETHFIHVDRSRLTLLLQGAPVLEELHLHHAVPPTDMSTIWGLKHLKLLRLRGLHLDDEQEDNLMEWDELNPFWGLSALQGLTLLDLSWNELPFVPPGVSALGALKVLRLCGNSCLGEDGEGRDLLPTEGPYLSTLELLDLRQTAVSCLPEALGMATALTRLDLYCCHDLGLCRGQVAEVVEQATVPQWQKMSLCAEMTQTQASLNALLLLGRAMPDLVVDNFGCSGSVSSECNSEYCANDDGEDDDEDSDSDSEGPYSDEDELYSDDEGLYTDDTTTDSDGGFFSDGHRDSESESESEGGDDDADTAVAGGGSDHVGAWVPPGELALLIRTNTAAVRAAYGLPPLGLQPGHAGAAQGAEGEYAFPPPGAAEGDSEGWETDNGESEEEVEV